MDAVAAWWWNGRKPLARAAGGDNRAGWVMAADAAAGETGPVEFGILGPLEVRRSGCAVPLGGPRQRAVLALLLLEANRAVSMDRLAEDLWGGHPPEGWATTLQTYVFHLRHALEPGRARGAGGVLVTRDRGYLLRVDREHLDAALFQDGFTAGRAALEAGRYADAAQTLRQALDLWRSPVLADLAGYAFTRPEAARLEELRLAALEARVDGDLALGRHDALTAELEQLAGEYPLRERLHGQLMLALYRCGRQAEALAAYRRARDLLAAELGIDPGEPLQRLHASVLTHDPALDWHGHPAEDHPAAAGTPAASPAPGPSRPRPTAGLRELDWVRRRARRLLVIGSALAVAAAVGIVAVARPWAGGPTGLPGNSVGLIGPAGGRVGAPVPVGSPAGLAYGDGSVWAVDSTEGTLSRINPATHAVVQTIPVGSAPTAVTVTGKDIWPATGDVSGPVFVGAGPAGIAVTPAAVWVANSLDLTVTKIDPATGRVTATIGVGDGPSAIAAAKNGVWVSDEFGATLDRIDPQTDRVDRVIFVGSSPQGMAVAGAGVWVAARPFAAATHRGGTLTVVTHWLPQRDPVLGGGAMDLPAMTAVYDGLVAMRKSGGTRGFTLVPDLAGRLPLPTDGAKTYTFALRPGVRYSSGVLVRASDFRRGMQRELTVGFNATYYDRILGAQRCGSHPRHCRLSAGIVTNDAAGTVTFHLAQADPDFLYKLALPLAVPVPPGAPSHVVQRAPFLPGTGPYMISQYRPDKSFTLVRNPHFRQWSYAAQPVGYPDIIRLVHVADPSKQLSAVMAGRADLVDLSVNGQSSRGLAVRYPTRLYSSVKVGTNYVFLNTRQPPFNHVTVRRAINYAIDRRHMVRLLDDGPGAAAVTCQILPADFPGHRPYCPYTTGSKNGTWHGPDMRKAIRLVKASHTTTVPVTVWSYFKDAGEGAYLVRLLKRLGYQATLHTVSADKYYPAIGNPQRKIQIGPTSWGADFPSASTFFFPVLSCRSLSQNPAYTNNSAEYCNPGTDKLAREAQAAQPTDLAASRRIWARVDRAVTAQAPWVPVDNYAWTVFVSARAENSQVHPNYGPLLDQMWVR